MYVLYCTVWISNVWKMIEVISGNLNEAEKSYNRWLPGIQNEPIRYNLESSDIEPPPLTLGENEPLLYRMLYFTAQGPLMASGSIKMFTMRLYSSSAEQ